MRMLKDSDIVRLSKDALLKISFEVSIGSEMGLRSAAATAGFYEALLGPHGYNTEEVQFMFSRIKLALCTPDPDIRRLVSLAEDGLDALAG